MRKKYRNSSRIADNAMRSTQNGVLYRNTAVFAGIGANGLSGIVPAVGRHWGDGESVTAAPGGKEEKHKLREFVKSRYRFRNGGKGDVGNGSLKPKMHMDPNAAYPLATRDFTQDLIRELALEAVKGQRMGNWLTDGNVESELARFQTKFEDYIPYAEPVNNENGGQSMLVGYGTTRCYDENGNSRNLVKGEYMSEKEALEQRKRYLKYDAVPFVKAKTGLGLTNFDKYPPELKFHILDAVYNIGNNGLLKKSPKWKKELETYESSSGYSIKDYDVSKILVNGDWSINHRTRDGKHHSSLSVRSAMRRNPQKIDTNHYKDVLNANMWDSLYDYYVNQKY